MTGSVKHRFARDLFSDAVLDGRITETTPLVEATSGTMAVAEACFARLPGLPFTAVVPHRTSKEKRARIERHGGSCHPVDPPLAIYDRARKLADEIGGHYVDRVIPVPDAASVAAMRHFATTTGLYAGAALWGAFHLVHRMKEEGVHGTVVLVAADSGQHHTTTYYDDTWIAGKGWNTTEPFATLARFTDSGTWRTR